MGTKPTNQPFTRGIGHKATTPIINLYTRGISQIRRVYNFVIKRPQTTSFPIKTMILINRIVDKLKCEK